MAEPLNRSQFKEYILRRLGAPVQQINVDDDQVEDRIDDALAFYQDYHHLGSQRSVYTHALTQQDINNGYISLPNHITSVLGFLPLGGNTSRNFMSDEYQVMRTTFNDLSSSYSYSLIPYYAALNRMADLDYWFGLTRSFTFNRNSSTVTFSTSGLNVGDKVAFEVQAATDPNTYNRIWSDRWLKMYATALVKKQWGENLKPFGGIQLLGGITLDGKTIYDEAVEDLRTLEEKMISMNSSIILDEIG